MNISSLENVHSTTAWTTILKITTASQLNGSTLYKINIKLKMAELGIYMLNPVVGLYPAD